MRRYVVALFALAALAVPATAISSPPTRTEISGSRTITTCGFPVIVSFSGYQILHVENAGDKLLFVLNYPELTTTLTNPANGISLSSPSPSQQFGFVFADGTFTNATDGLTARWVSPGDGMLGGIVGRFNAVYYPDGTITIQIAGIYGEAFGPACPILAG